ncbi:MAG: 30S ribosome-binding factor RbfA [Clostridia bacterium]
MPVNRYDRIAEEMKKALSEVIRELKDPRVLDMTTVMHVEISSDLCLAKVRISVYDKSDEARVECVKALNHASGFLAHEMGQRIDIRKVPALKFTLDNSIEYSVHIGSILDGLNIKKGENDGESE